MLKKYRALLHNLIISLLSLFILSCNNAPDDNSSKNNRRVLVRVEISMSDVSANGTSDLSVIKGTQQPLIATGHYSDNTIEDLTKFVSWETKNSEIGTVDEKGIFRGLIEGNVIITASIGGVVSDDFRLTVISPALRYIQVSPSPISIARGQSKQLVATAIYSNGSSVDITNTVAWLSTETSVAIVTPSGVLMGISPGSTTITANFSGVSSNAVQAQITDASLVSIQVSPSPISIAHGQSKQLVATATYSNGTSADITNTASWLSTETSVAIVMPGGVLMGVSPGSATVTANFSGVSSNAVQAQITDASLVSIQVSPSPISIAHGQSKQLTATAIYSNGTSADITNTAAWLSTETSVAIVTPSGILVGASPGSTTVTANFSGVSSNAVQAQITDAALVSIHVSPSPISIAHGQSKQLVATATYSNGTSADITNTVAWLSTETSVAIVTPGGILMGVSPGSATVTANFSGVSSNAVQAQITDAALVSIHVSPSPISIAHGQSKQLVATATYSNGTSADITNTVAWLSTETSVAIVTPGGILMGVSPGSATVTANFSGVSSNAVQAQITDAALVSIQVSPSSISIAHGQSQQLVATATYSNGTRADITNTVAWLSTEPSVAIVTPGGILMGVSPGSTTVTANFSGISSNTVKIQINEVVISFNSTPPQNDLVGSLEARVFFAQSQIIPATLKEGDRQPILASLRKSLFLVQPLRVDNTSPIVVNAYSKDNSHLGTLTLSPPQEMPKTVYYNAELPIPAGEVSFTPKTGTSLVISNNSELANLSDKNGNYLLGKLRDNALVAIKTIDGHWTPNIYLPINSELEGKVVTIQSNASSRSVIHNGNKQRIISQGQIERYAFNNGQWFNEEELENNRLTYISDTWSGELPAEWIQPGLNIVIQQGDMEGVLNNINIGAPGELLLHTIDIGMLTTPRNAFYFANDKEAQRQYFQTIPASRMIISQYAPIYLKEVMLPTGVLLTDFDPSEGGWHGGTMRQRIGKELVSHGINNANYGINSSNGEGEGGHPYTVAQLTAHNSRGKYVNGVRVHGGSGGGGIVTIEASLGNEFSHEVGHNYGLGHYVDGFRGSIHRSADNINSSWGWDSDKRFFIPNFYPVKTYQDSCLDNQCQGPFDGRKFGVDAMAGGSPFSKANNFTFYTPNSSSIIQHFFESKAVFDRKSPTGFSKWNNKTLRMEPYQNRIDNIELRDASIDQLSETGLSALLAESSMVRVSMWDGRWARNIQVPSASNENKGRNLIIAHSAGYNSHLFINGIEVIISNGFRKNFISDGNKWVEVPLVDTSVARVPKDFGVPVTTIIGYYDPLGELKSYIYPALYGAYGFIYPDDSSSISNNGCQLQVETSDGVKHFQLANYRINGYSMNKFHVNIPTAIAPNIASIFCNGNKLDQKIIQPLEQAISFNVYGKPLESVTSKIE